MDTMHRSFRTLTTCTAFPFVVFTSFGAFWLGYAATLVPTYGAYGNYADPNNAASTGLETRGFNIGIGKPPSPPPLPPPTHR